MGRALIVSAGASSNEYISARLAELGYTRPMIIPSGAEARRRMLESDFELIVVNAPLPDEFGHELCSSAVEKTDAINGKRRVIKTLVNRLFKELFGNYRAARRNHFL